MVHNSYVLDQMLGKVTGYQVTDCTVTLEENGLPATCQAILRPQNKFSGIPAMLALFNHVRSL